MQHIRKYWPFKSLANFSVVAFVTSGTAFLATKYDNERKLDHPIAAEALRLVERDDRIVESIGFPVAWSSNSRNFVDKSDKTYNAEFFIEGPKGKLLLQVAAESLPLETLKADYEKLSKELSEEKSADYQTKLSQKNKLEAFYIPDPQTASFCEKSLNNKSSDITADQIEIPAESLFWGIGYLATAGDQKKPICADSSTSK